MYIIVLLACSSRPRPGRVLFRARCTRWMGVCSGLSSTLSSRAALPSSTREGAHGALRASSSFFTNLNRVLRRSTEEEMNTEYRVDLEI